MKLHPKKRRDIIMFVISTAVGLVNTPLGIAISAYFLMWQLRDEDDE